MSRAWQALAHAQEQNASLQRSETALKQRYHKLRSVTEQPNYVLGAAHVSPSHPRVTQVGPAVEWREGEWAPGGAEHATPLLQLTGPGGTAAGKGATRTRSSSAPRGGALVRRRGGSTSPHRTPLAASMGGGLDAPVSMVTAMKAEGIVRPLLEALPQTVWTRIQQSLRARYYRPASGGR